MIYFTSLLISFALIATVSSLRISMKTYKAKYASAVVGLASTVLLLNPIEVLAAADCNKNCVSNCSRVAPGSMDYCVASCKDYCEQDDRSSTKYCPPLVDLFVITDKMVSRAAKILQEVKLVRLEDLLMGQLSTAKISRQSSSNLFPMAFWTNINIRQRE